MRSFIASSLLLVAACSAGDEAQRARAAALPFQAEVMGAFDEPWAIAMLPDGTMLITEKKGKLKLRGVGGNLANVTGVPAVSYSAQGGLLDVVAAPDFATSHIVYLTYAEPRPTGDALALMRARLDGSAAMPMLADARVIWRSGSDGEGGQFGAVVAFAPDGQSLFLSSGERQRFTPAQDGDQALGKILHLTLDGAPAPGNPGEGKIGAATIGVIDPPDNTGAAPAARVRTVAARQPNTTPAETWSTGHRNPYGLAFDGAGNLWEIEMGPRGGDEVNLILPGKNYGWPRVSNGSNYEGLDIPDHRAGDGFEAPKVFWNPSISPAGLIVYSGKLFPQWKGSLLLGGLSSQALIRITLNGTTASKADQWDMGARIRDVAEAADGAIWLIEDEGSLVRLTPR